MMVEHLKVQAQVQVQEQEQVQVQVQERPQASFAERAVLPAG